MLGEFIRSHKIISSVIVLLVVGFLIFALYGYISRIGKEPVQIFVIPNTATLTIDGQPYRPGTSYLAPGTYTVKATYEGFEDYEASITINQPNTTDIDIALTPASEEAEKWRQDNMDLYLQREGRVGTRANEFGIAFQEKHPITAQLPVRNPTFTIGHRLDPDDQSQIILEITAITGLRNAAVQQIRTMGFEPTDFKINFNNYENPFDE